MNGVDIIGGGGIGLATVYEFFKKDMKEYYDLYLISININDYEFGI